MDREKQIEEMARDLCHLTCTCEECGNVAEVNKHRCKAKVYARRAYEAGYRKVVTSDWLTKGISEEQLEREKQEALDEFAEKLGYRKQSEGEWVRPPCYIGQEIWHITKHYDGRIEIGRGKVSMLQQKAGKSWKIRITVNSSVWDFTPNEIGTEYFLTREQAEKALAERSENGKS
jgi:hypothetical protein